MDLCHEYGHDTSREPDCRRCGASPKTQAADEKHQRAQAAVEEAEERIRHHEAAIEREKMALFDLEDAESAAEKALQAAICEDQGHDWLGGACGRCGRCPAKRAEFEHVTVVPA